MESSHRAIFSWPPDMDPKEGLTLAEVQTVMATIIAKNVFSSTAGDLVTVKEAQIRQLAITELT
ncbi:DUF2922 domain-containing protein [Sporomusa sp.]|uniref:DUF2922 domain-containing protein n=1 Tax=Sporomusa sp. TaxID=2078658 RepID=UPI002D0100BD|nr:DUF2922 domain-containing protein [Sporomusa sp.]HWR43534.1 DUF2922 domain-containing protein [Sporomusa sp.]